MRDEIRKLTIESAVEERLQVERRRLYEMVSKDPDRRTTRRKLKERKQQIRENLITEAKKAARWDELSFLQKYGFLGFGFSWWGFILWIVQLAIQQLFADKR